MSCVRSAGATRRPRVPAVPQDAIVTLEESERIAHSAGPRRNGRADPRARRRRRAARHQPEHPPVTDEEARHHETARVSTARSREAARCRQRSRLPRRPIPGGACLCNPTRRRRLPPQMRVAAPCGPAVAFRQLGRLTVRALMVVARSQPTPRCCSTPQSARPSSSTCLSAGKRNTWPRDHSEAVMSKVLILGATGSLGRYVTQQAIAANHEVSALVRTPSKLPVEVRERVVVHQADLAATSAADLAAILQGHDAVINAAGLVTEGQGFVDLVGASRQRVWSPSPSRIGRSAGFSRAQPCSISMTVVDGASISPGSPPRTGRTGPTMTASGRPRSTGEYCVRGRWCISQPLGLARMRISLDRVPVRDPLVHPVPARSPGPARSSSGEFPR